MTPERWQAVGNLFNDALELARDQRAAWVSQACSGDTEVQHEVLSLLANHDAAQGGFVQEQVKSAVVALYESAPGPARAGPYRIVRELGRGGMGTVYLAERDDEQYQTQVAIKLVRPGMDTDFILARFRRERQTLAWLQHANIARLLDGGTTDDGLPYIVMEYIDGVRITDYARDRSLDLNDRIRLFLSVCLAVDYAHRNFIVHRDLKPGNILVDRDGVPKLLDFGICKLLYSDPMATEETSAGMLTPEYASPEQVRGDPVTVLSDVYSLGAVLYELLVLERPHRIGKTTPRAIEEAICERDVTVPSATCADRSLSRRLHGDLDNILLHALEKEPQRRYESAAALAADLRRYLAHEPVLARPQTLAYQAAKFARRNRGAVAATAAIMLALTAGAVVSAREAANARRRLGQVRGLANKFVFDVHDAVRDLPGSTRARQLIAQTGLDYLDAIAPDARGNPQFEKELAAAYHRLADVQGGVSSSNLGNTRGALPSYRKALALLDDVARRTPSDTAVLAERAAIYMRIGGIQAAERHASDALKTFEEGMRVEQTNPSDPAILNELAGLHIGRSDVRRLTGDLAGALADATRALELFELVAVARGKTAATLQPIASAHSNVGMAQSAAGRLNEALAHYRQAVSYMEQALALDPKSVAYRRELMLSWSHVADVSGNPNLQNLGDLAAAREGYRKIVGIAKEIHQSDPADQRALSDHGIALSRLATSMPDDDRAAKIAAFRESLEVLRKGARNNPDNRVIRLYLGSVNKDLGETLHPVDRSAAHAAWSECAELAETFVKQGQRSGLVLLVLCRGKLAEAAGSQGQRAQALAHAQRAMQAVDEATRTAPVPLTLPRAYAAMGLAYASLSRSGARQPDDRAQARQWLEKTRDAWEKAKSDPGFGAPHRRERQEAEAALKALGGQL